MSGVEVVPDFFEGCAVDITEDDAAAGSAEDVAERVNVNALCTEKGVLAGFVYKLLRGFEVFKISKVCSGPAGESAGVVFHSLQENV